MKFSVITPSFNQASFIGRTIDSVITQKGDFKVEYIIMDGGSTDGTVEILKKYDWKIKSGQYNKLNQGVMFTWESKKDNGQSDAINQGLKKATGDIIAYLNSDDYYQRDTFSKVAKVFFNNKLCEWLTGYCQIVDEEDRPIQSLITKYKIFWLNHADYKILLTLNFVSQPATFWRKSASDRVGQFSEKLHLTMDYDYWLRLGQKSNPIIMKDYLASFRIHGSSKGKEQYLKQFDEDLETARKYCQNKFIITLHLFHNMMVKFVYLFVKR